MVKGPGQRRCSEADKGLLRRARLTVPASLTGRWVRPIHSALVWQGFGRLRREAHVSAEQGHPQAAARVPRAHGDRRRPARDRAAACQGAQAPVLLSVATQATGSAWAHAGPHPLGWSASSGAANSSPWRERAAAGSHRGSSCRRARAARPGRSASASPPAGGSEGRWRATGRGAGCGRRYVPFFPVPPSQVMTTFSWRGQRS
jgi:hypothetical protein